MQVWRLSRAMAAWTVVVILAPEPAGAAAVSDATPMAVQRVLDQAAPILFVGGRPVETQPLRTFYEQRQHLPIWFDATGNGGRADALTRALHDAAHEGLDPAAYDVSVPVVSALATGGSDRGDPAEARAAAEVSLSAALVRYALDVRRGRAAPGRADASGRVTPKPLDPVVLLSDAAGAADLKRFVEGLAPSDGFYQGLRKALAVHRTVAAGGGWPALPDGPTLAPGGSDPRVPVLRERLQISGDLPAIAPGRNGQRFDEGLRAAVVRFQERHGLAADGSVGPRTREALNVPVESRIRQLLVNLERARWLPETLGDPHVLVNLAAFQLEVVEADRPVLDMRVVVGRPARSTPAFSDEIRYLEFNPYWHVPKTILKEDKLPLLRRNPAALAAEGIRVIGPGGQRIDPTAIDWSQVSGERFPYALRQDPGERNALGRIKFMFPNPYDIYLHDTPSKGLFARSIRAFSSGCIRVEKPIDLAEYLLRGNGDWPRERIEEAIGKGRNRSVMLARPVPVHLLYLTAWVDRAGRLQFREDLYNRDAKLVAALDPLRP